ncbi:MAG: hypothetical protein ACM3Q2_04315, partial [Syntrophothermus sp.]
MKKKIMVLAVSIFTAVFFTNINAEGGGGKSNLKKSDGTPSYARFNINNISTFFYSDGISDINLQQNSGFTFPKGSGKTAVFQTGFVWGGKVNNQVRVGGFTYKSGVQPGRIIGTGAASKADDPNSPAVRMYRIRPDYKTGNMAAEIKDGEGTEAEIRAQYEKDWNEWPADWGAPYNDVNGDKKYDPAVDIPGVTGAHQTIWFVNNDLDSTKCLSLYGSPSIGLELQTTVWGYNQAGAMGNVLFRKYKLINKSVNNITDMYVTNWTDPDVGDAGDDFTGCDTLSGLSFVYNATIPDKVYGNQPPAIGFDFLQGPVVPAALADTAIYDGKFVTGKKNLPMTAFYYFIGGDAVMDGPTMGGDFVRGTLRFYNLMQGKNGSTGEYFPVPGGGVTKFPLSGDPVAGTGYLDGRLYSKGDRRIGSASGPFNLAAGDTQEVVIAEIAAGGPGSGMNNIQAVQLLKGYDKLIQGAFNKFFDDPSAKIKSPQASVSELNGEVILYWGTDPAAAASLESFSYGGYTFEGYNVYQLPSQNATKAEAKRIATFDVINGITYVLGDYLDPDYGIILKVIQQFGTNSGISRSLRLKTDALSNQPLQNGQKYYYAVTAYAITNDAQQPLSNIETPLTALSAVPRLPDAKYYGTYGDTLKVSRFAGKSDGRIIPLVIDPKALTGHDYSVSFENINNSLVWKLKDLTTGVVRLKDQNNFSGDNTYYICDGMMVKVISPETGLKPDDMYSTEDTAKWGWSIPSGQRRWTWTNANASSYQMGTFGGGAGNFNCIGSSIDWNWMTGSGSTVTGDKLRNVLLKFAATDTAGVPADANDPNVSYAYRYMRACQAAPVKPDFAQYIINKSSSYDFQDFRKGFPFAAYDLESVPPRRLAVGFLENNVANGLVNGRWWPQNFTFADP